MPDLRSCSTMPKHAICRLTTLLHCFSASAARSVWRVPSTKLDSLPSCNFSMRFVGTQGIRHIGIFNKPYDNLTILNKSCDGSKAILAENASPSRFPTRQATAHQHSQPNASFAVKRSRRPRPDKRRKKADGVGRSCRPQRFGGNVTHEVNY